MALFGRRRDEAPQAWVSALEEVVSALPDSRAVIDYVLTGRRHEVLAALSRNGFISHTLAPHEVAPTRVLYSGLGDVDAAVLRRWGRVLDALSGQQTWGLALGDVAGCHWPELMMNRATQATPAHASLPFTFADLQRIAAEDGAGAADLVRAAFVVPAYSRYYSHQSARGQLHRLPGFAEAVLAHCGVASAALTSGTAEERIVAASLLGTLGDSVLLAMPGAIAEAATTTSAQVRDAARPLWARVADATVEPLRLLATTGKPDQRGQALELLIDIPGQRDWVLETAEADRAASVRALTTRWQAAGAAVPDELPPEPLPLPPWALPRDDAERLAEGLVQVLRDVVRGHNRSIQILRTRHPQAPYLRELDYPERTLARDLARLLAADRPLTVKDAFDVRLPVHLAVEAVLRHLDHHGCSAQTLLQVMVAFGWVAPGQLGFRPYADALERMHSRTGGPDLLSIQRILDAVGVDGRGHIWASYAARWGTHLGRDWPDQQVWPFFAHNLGWLLEEASNQLPWGSDERALFAALATFPTPPARVVDHLYDLALGPRKSLRVPAQDALERHDQRAVRAAAGLEDGKGETRLVAAQWLARIADPVSLPALQRAWKKEKHDVVRGALLDALGALGEDPETYLDPAATTSTAEKALARGLPAALSWLDWDGVPEVHWASSGEAVPRVVVQWLCAVAVKAKSPEPDAVLRHYSALFEPQSRERLAAHLLTAWLREDARPIPAAEAEQRAAQSAGYTHQWYANQPGSPYYGMTLEQLTAALLPSYPKTPAGSATPSKGMLAVVAACGGRDVVPPTERFLKEWYGQRAAQGKALIGMLAWVEHPSATQLVLSVGSRFRTKSFQDEAIKHAQALADRKGWTVDELADRTIPTAGFDDAGILELSYGPRTFTGRLRPDLTIELHDPDGKPIKALPAPRQSDDAELAKDAKKTFTAAKKELKGIATLQTQRLYEALCTERSWSAEDWERYLLHHPVVGPAVRRLVWVATTDDGSTEVVFRPLDDGSLTDVDDEEVKLPADSRVRVAHDSLLAPEQLERWTEHLADYEVTPLFEQLGRGLHTLTPELRSRREVTDFRGHMLEAFSLRGRATKLGYTRGQTQDAGWFYTYDKRFPTLGIVAEIGFTGNWLPEENRTVALTTLGFRRQSEGGSTPLTLGEVPAVLVSECWHDQRLIAAEGTGFDPNWEKKTEA